MLQQAFNPQFVIFDEASFFRDPELFYMLGQLRRDIRVLFVGDHNQLSPPTFTNEGRDAWRTSAFERLMEKRYEQTTLSVEYRSYDLIYRPTSAVYYDNQVRSSRLVSPREGIVHEGSPIVLSAGLDGIGRWAVTEMLGFLNLPRVSFDTQKDSTGSWFRTQEAYLGINLARALINAGVRDVLIMSPYRAQVTLSKRLWAQENPNAVRSPRIQTVDASQVSEADAVIVLITRNAGAPGFLRSRKRTNVMTSRASNFLYFIGNWSWVSGAATLRDAMPFYTLMNSHNHRLGQEGKNLV